MNRRSAPFAIVISGPSGVGKTTIEEGLVSQDPLLRASVSATTRPPRDQEVSGRDYFFLSREEFERMKDHDLVEWAEVHDELYGTPRQFVEDEFRAGRDVILNIDVQGGSRVKKAFPDAVLVFILPPSFEALRERILKRSAREPADLGRRLENATKEIDAARDYDYLVVNDDLETAVSQVRAIIEAERCRRERHGPGFVERFKQPAPRRKS